MKILRWTDLLILAASGWLTDDIIVVSEADRRYHKRQREGGMNPSCVSDNDIRNFHRWLVRHRLVAPSKY